MTVFEVLRNKIDEQVVNITDDLANGSAKNYDEYQKFCGVIKGLYTAKIFIEDLERQTEEDYEDDD
tara:strand:+ start:5031 stop:5228 length:198 start_codon:yes stop_codon:yes gene_type:complete